MQTQIGPTLREARIRHHIDLIEIEERTKIRVRYLRALENEEWDVLPGPTYTRSFIRTYANFLGLDGERLADDFRRIEEDQVLDSAPREPRPLPGRQGRSAPRFGPGVLAALIVVVLIGVLLVLGLTSNSGDNGGTASQAADHGRAGKHRGNAGANHRRPGVSMQLTATGEVWVCALAADGTRVVNGQILATGAQAGPFRSGKFDLAFGNGQVQLQVNGKQYPVENSPSPVGYEVTAGGVHPLAAGTRPNCT